MTTASLELEVLAGGPLGIVAGMDESVAALSRVPLPLASSHRHRRRSRWPDGFQGAGLAASQGRRSTKFRSWVTHRRGVRLCPGDRPLGNRFCSSAGGSACAGGCAGCRVRARRRAAGRSHDWLTEPGDLFGCADGRRIPFGVLLPVHMQVQGRRFLRVVAAASVLASAGSTDAEPDPGVWLEAAGCGSASHARNRSARGQRFSVRGRYRWRPQSRGRAGRHRRPGGPRPAWWFVNEEEIEGRGNLGWSFSGIPRRHRPV